MGNFSKKLTACILMLAVLAAPLLTGATLPTFSPGASALRLSGDRPDGEPVSPSISVGNKKNVESEKYPHKKIKSRIKKYAEINSDVKGWLTIPNTNINMPINYSSENNNYYAYRTWQGVNHPNTYYLNFVETATYLDSRTIFGETWKKSSRNTVIYGHNWTNLRDPLDIGSNNSHIMFGQLPSYTNMDFAKSNPHIYYSTENNEGIWRVFAVAYAEISEDFFYNNPNPKKEDFGKLIKEWQSRSMYNFDVDVDENDRIITLSTCTRQNNGVGAQQRFVVVARLLRDGETENQKVGVTVNDNMKKPKF